MTAETVSDGAALTIGIAITLFIAVCIAAGAYGVWVHAEHSSG
jgi:hypothetical protein